VSEDKSPIEKAVELMVYAPVGFANFIRSMVPGWIEMGRQEVTKQVGTAKVMTEFAVAQGRKDAEKAVLQASEVVSNLASRRQPTPPPAPAPRPAPAAPATSAATTPSSAASPSSSPTGNGPRPSAEGLAIPGYDSLAASQVVQRLGGLSSAELDAVKAYEEGTRGRRTILNKVGQLQAETSQ
jgi:hypothetical protein